MRYVEKYLQTNLTSQDTDGKSHELTKLLAELIALTSVF